MTVQTFQKGKFYTLPIKDFREEGNNTFFIVDANNREYAIRMFDFQKSDKSVFEMKDLPVVVLVNQRTVSGGDEMSDLLSSFPNVTLMGMTPSNCSCQATGGVSYLADGLFVIYYPVVLNLTDANNDPLIDTDTSRETRIPLEVRIPINEKAVREIFDEEQQDYELEYAVDWLSNHH